MHISTQDVQKYAVACLLIASKLFGCTGSQAELGFGMVHVFIFIHTYIY